MLTNRQLMWFDDGERTSLEDWYMDGNRGRPSARVVSLDTKKTWRMAELSGENLPDKMGHAAEILMTQPEADALLITYVGMTILPDGGSDWVPQAKVGELMLSGAPEATNAGRALFTVGTDETAYLYVVVNRFDVEDRKVVWGKRMTNVVTPAHVEHDSMLNGLMAGMEVGRKALSGAVAQNGGDKLPNDIIRAGVAVAMAKGAHTHQLKLRMRDHIDYRPVRSLLEKAGTTFYEENRG